MTSLDSRMKDFEKISRVKLLPKVPVILRIDGKNFHTFTKNMHRPWDERLNSSMWEAGIYTCSRIMGAKVAYTQSDECNILLTDWDTSRTRPWFEYRVQKLCSIAAGFYTAGFLRAFVKHFKIDMNDLSELPVFDTRAFNLPRQEVVNYFIWRQQDATRNSLQMLTRCYFSHQETQGKNTNQLQEMLWHKHKVNWNDCDIWQKRGACIKKQSNTMNPPKLTWQIDSSPPTFTKQPEYIEDYLKPKMDK